MHFPAAILPFCFLSILSLVVVNAQFPSVCIPNILTDKECCPDWCGGEYRGSCENIVYNQLNSGDREGDLDRLSWPSVFFTRACKCKGNYWGYKCQDCKPGYRGYDCSEAYTVTRKNVKNLSPGEIRTFQDALNRAQFTTSEYKVMKVVRSDITAENIDESFSEVTIYRWLAWLHYYVSRRNVKPDGSGDSDDETKMDAAHEGPAFGPWHRMYLLILEHELRKLSGDDNFALPYWDWIGQTNQCDICNDEYLGSSSAEQGYVVQGFLSGWKALCTKFREDQARGTLCDPDQNQVDLVRFTGDPELSDPLFLIPTREEVEVTLTETTWDRKPVDYTSTQNTWVKADCSFRGMLEGYTASSVHYGGDCIQGLGCGVDPVTRPIGVNDIHNRVHLFLGGAKDYETIDGTMGTVEFASMDPIFFMHHNMVDRLYELWLRRNGDDRSLYPSDGLPLGQEWESNMVPFFPVWPVSYAFRKSSNLGYTFDDLKDDFELREAQACQLKEGRACSENGAKDVSKGFGDEVESLLAKLFGSGRRESFGRMTKPRRIMSGEDAFRVAWKETSIIVEEERRYSTSGPQ